MLQLDQLDLRQDGFRLFADVTVTGPGLCAVIGPSGAGKSTLLAAIGGFLDPVAGRVLWQGRDLTDLAPSARPITTLFQENNLFPHLSLAENVGLGLSPRLRLSSDQQTTVTRALARVGLEGFGVRTPGEVSGGQQSRAALARILVMDRPVVLLDEPFSALGPGLKADMLTLLSEMIAERGLTALMVTHDPEDARRFAQTTLTVMDGAVEGPLDTHIMFENPSEDLQLYLGL